MRLVRRSLLLCTALLAVALIAVSAQAASASTYFVNLAGADTNPCSQAAPCKTIGKALEVAATGPETPTIEVAAGAYNEPEALKVEGSGDDGVTIVGTSSAATVIVAPEKSTEPAIKLGIDGGHATLASLAILVPPEAEGAAIESEESLVLQNVAVVMDDPVNQNAIDQGSFGSLTGEGLTITMEGGNEGKAVSANTSPVTLSSSTIRVAAGSSAGGIFDSAGSLTLNGDTFAMNGLASGEAVEDDFGTISMTGDTIDEGGISSDAIFTDAPSSASFTHVTVQMTNHESEHVGIQQDHGSATFDGVTVEGAWKGSAISTAGTAFALVDSRLTGGPEGQAPILNFLGNVEGVGWLIQRSTIQAAQTDAAAVRVQQGSMTLDSSAVLGGTKALEFVNAGPRPRVLTVAASTVDAGVVGAADEKDHDLALKAEHGASTAANVLGSILVEPQKADGEGTAIACAYSDLPNQAQAPSSTLGAISCATGLNGDTSTVPASLFATPTLGLGLLPGSVAIDSVPASAIVLPFGFTPSATDLLGQPRDVDGNGDCVAVQDRGAVELQGHATPCPPVKGAITSLKLSPVAFLAAPSGAAVAKSAPAKHGTTITYVDSQVAVTTFTVLAHEAGRRVGGSCVKPSKKNRKHKRCVRVVTLGSFTHKDVAGANSLRFTGRLNGRKLAKRGYELQAVPRNAAGAGATVSRSFTIK
jgi:Protein of unknown function (DUF1565)